MGVRADVGPERPEWTEQDALDALGKRPDLARRLEAGDPEALAEYLELMPGVSVKSVEPR